MEDFLKVVIFACLLFWGRVFAQTPQAHQSGGEEHIVIIDTSHPTPPLVSEVLERLALKESHSDVKYVYNNSHFKGFSASMKSHCLDLLANMSDVSMVEKSTKIASAGLISKRQSQPYTTRSSATWGLQRISMASQMTGSPKDMDYTYAYANGDLGQGVDIYIVDTGIYTEHNVFNGRAKMVWSHSQDLTDKDGHGTHVSGTAAGDILGVASKANILGIKALANDGSGSSSDVVAGIDFVIKNHEKRLNDPDHKGSVLSMSLASGSPVQAIDAAVQAAVGAGVHTCVAAGNDHQDACQSSPAAAGGVHGPAITVGSVDIEAQRSSFSNYGSCVDIYAPGEAIISSWIGAPNMVNSMSGTSMATPHVTGIVAYAMANKTLAQNPGLMKEWVIMNGLQINNDILLANNGVHQTGTTAQGMLGRTKLSKRTISALSAHHREKRDVTAVSFFEALNSMYRDEDEPADAPPADKPATKSGSKPAKATPCPKKHSP